MKHLKSYKIFESSNLELEKELEKYSITKYTLNDDGSIDISEHTDLSTNNLNVIPFKFNKINGDFYYSYNRIKTLKNCPRYIEGLFDCSNNQLESLEFGPEYVGYSYFCNDNKLITLKGCIDEVHGSFNCSFNQLISLEFCPMQVEGWFYCSDNKLTELDRSPFIRKELWCGGMFKSEPEFNGSCEKLIWK